MEATRVDPEDLEQLNALGATLAGRACTVTGTRAPNGLELWDFAAAGWDVLALVDGDAVRGVAIVRAETGQVQWVVTLDDDDYTEASRATARWAIDRAGRAWGIVEDPTHRRDSAAILGGTIAGHVVEYRGD